MLAVLCFSVKNCTYKNQRVSNSFYGNIVFLVRQQVSCVQVAVVPHFVVVVDLV